MTASRSPNPASSSSPARPVLATPATQEIPGLVIPTVEGGLLCHQEMSREAARRQVECPPVLSMSLPSSAGVDIPRLMRAGQTDKVADTIAAAVECLHAAGATFAAITANLLHLIFDDIRARSSLPLINIVNVVADYATRRGYGAVGLLGTAPIMESDLYPRALAQAGVKVIVPDAGGRQFVNRIIFDELLAGVVTPASREEMARVARGLQQGGAQAIALCCTELGMVLDDSPALPALDSTKLLAHAVLDRCLLKT